MDAGHGDGFGGSGNGRSGGVVKPGRIDGHNSPYRSGSHAIKSRVKDELIHIFREHAHKGARKDKVVGSKTVDKRVKDIKSFFSDLFKLHYKIESVHSLKQKHLVAVFHFLEEQGQSASTLQNKISMMRLFCEWIGKPGMVGDAREYVRDPLSVTRTMVVQEDKSWEGNGIDAMEKIDLIRLEDERAAGVLLLCRGFGLRKKEALMMNIFKSIDGNNLMVVYGTKGGRARSVPIEHDWQWALLEDVKGLVDQTTGRLMRRGYTVEQSIRRVNYMLEKHGLVLAKAGVSAHGLRHQYMQECFKEQTGVDAPIKGGDIATLDKKELDEVTGRLMERAGHSRLTIGSSYYGSRRRKKAS